MTCDEAGSSGWLRHEPDEDPGREERDVGEDAFERRGERGRSAERYHARKALIGDWVPRSGDPLSGPVSVAP